MHFMHLFFPLFFGMKWNQSKWHLKSVTEFNWWEFSNGINRITRMTDVVVDLTPLSIVRVYLFYFTLFYFNFSRSVCTRPLADSLSTINFEYLIMFAKWQRCWLINAIIKATMSQILLVWFLFLFLFFYISSIVSQWQCIYIYEMKNEMLDCAQP